MRKLWLHFTFALFALHAVFATAQTIEVLHSFSGGGDGTTPFGGVVRDSAGNLYGTTEFGGNALCPSQPGCGTVYKVDATGTKTTLHDFTGTDGAAPRATLIRDASGNLYGTTFSGGGQSCGREGCGTVFKIDSSNTFTVLHRFTGAPDGANPWAGLVADEAGNLYGTTTSGGAVTSTFLTGCGVVFKVDPAGHETVLYRFSCGTDGNASYSTLLRDTQGNLFGTTILGGDLSCFGGFGCGTVFKLDATGKESVLHAFTGEPDASFPQASLTYFGGYFYSTSSTGGALGFGAVFKVDKAGNESVLYSFGSNPLDGLFPIDALIHDKQGNLYGTTGIIRSTVFKIDPSGNETVLSTFGPHGTGTGPSAGLTRDEAGNLYGTTESGIGTSGFGTVFELKP
jgi:uncharacterized repeat protein (TIGR03803 family)